MALVDQDRLSLYRFVMEESCFALFTAAFFCKQSMAARLPSHAATFWVRGEGDAAPSPSATSSLGLHSLLHSMRVKGHSQRGARRLLAELAADINQHLKALEEKSFS